MTTDTAAQTGNGAASSGAGEPNQRQDGAGKADPNPHKTVRGSIERAFKEAGLEGADPVNDTDRSRAVLRKGNGADGELDETERANREKTFKSQQQEAEKAQRDAEGKTAEKDKAGAKEKDDKTDKGERKDATAKDGKDKAGEKDDKQPRNEKGQLQSKDPDRQKELDAERERAAAEKAGTGKKWDQAPARLHDQAKAAWMQAPEHVRADVHRAFGEMEEGLRQHAEAKKFADGLTEYSELAKKHNTTVKDALDRYVAADRRLSEDPVAAVKELLEGRGLDFRKVAEAYLKMDPKDVERMTEMGKLETRLAKLEGGEKAQTEQRKAGGAAAQQQFRKQIDTAVAEFRAANPRAVELDDVMARLITSGEAKSLQHAFELAERMHPAKQPPKVDTPDPAAQTRKTELADPGSSDTASDAERRRKPSKNPREAVKRSIDAVGL